jgi:hypothetical protein
MNKRYFNLSLLLVLVICFALPLLGAGKSSGSNRSVQKVTGSPAYTYMDISNFSTVFRNDGISDIDNQQLNSGFIFPRGSGKTCVFQSGFLWGGKINDSIKVGGTTYNTGLQPGKILSPGVAEDPDLAKNRIYRVRPDYKTASLASEAANEGTSVDAIYSQFDADWQNWPAADGAPYTDVNSNGHYDPDVDIPGVPGADMTIWFVANDLNSTNTQHLYGSTPMGMELQATIWAYAQQGALGNMLFRKYLLINKGLSTVDSMYVSMWSDIDDGNATDDYAGCDTTLSLAYAYNANAVDAVYDPLPPPAVGFDFFQGPVVNGSESDTAIFRGVKVGGKRNLPMTAFYYFARGDANVTDPTLQDYQGSLQFYNFLRGRVGKTGAPFADPNTGQITTFPLAGDPQSRTGWVDGQVLPAGDRRLGMSSGPISMAPGDTQEVVVAEIAAGAIAGVDRISAIGLLKFYDQQAQLAYNNFFNLPTPPPSPKASIAELERSIVLNWGSDTTAFNSTESFNSKGYAFQGYNVYQLPSASATIDQAKRLVTYDISDGTGKIKDFYFDPGTGEVLVTVKQFGNDTGIKRFFEITEDVLGGGGPLIDGKRYYFAVTGYNYNPSKDAVPNNLESPLSIITVVPHSNNPGVRYGANALDTVAGVTHTVVGNNSMSEGIVTPIVVDPTKLTGHVYHVTFDTTGGTIGWNLIDSTANKQLINHSTNQSGDQTYLVVDGMQVRVEGPPPGMKDWSIPAGTREWTWSNADGFGLEGFNGAIGMGYNNWFSSSSTTPTQLHNVLLKFAAVDSATGALIDPADTLASFGYRYLRHATSPAAKPEFLPYIVNPSAGYAYQDYKKGVPFAAYDIETNRRLMVGHLETNDATGLVDGRYYPPSSNAPDPNTGGGAREFFFIFDVPYSTTPDPALQDDILDVTMPIMWFGTPNRRGEQYFHAGDEFEILANHPNNFPDVFRFVAPSVTRSNDLAKQDVQSINVFPNPYYAANSQELNKYQHFITFSHLPTVATIRIFNLAGILVRTLAKTDASTQYQRWDLNNENQLPVASGLYIAYIDMPELGTTKILKFTVIQKQQILDRF